MIDSRNFFDQPVKTILEHMVTLEILLIVKRMIKKVVDYLIIHISKESISRLK